MTKIKFQCEACCYITHNKYDWNKHLSTKKHAKNVILSKKTAIEHSFNPNDITSIPKQNFGNVWINMNGGFDGYISKFRYYNYAIEPYQITQICKIGPSSLNDINKKEDSPPYLAADYWTTTGFPEAGGFPKRN